MGNLGLGISVDSILDHGGDLLRVVSDGGLQCLAGSLGIGMLSSSLGLESDHLLGTLLNGELEVLLGHIGSRADGIDHLLAHLGASLLGEVGQSLDRHVGLLLEFGDLGGELVVDKPLGVLVHLLTVLLDELGALLTSLDGLADGVLQLVLVGLLHSSELFATTLGLGSLLINDTSQVLDLGVSLLVVLVDNFSELVNLLLELSLGLAHSIHGIELHAASGSGPH